MEYGSSCEPTEVTDDNEGTYVSTADRIIITCYFTLTTLSTVGYGDFYPVSIGEKIVGSIIQIIGVTFFSLLMGNFVKVIQDFGD